jgi:hypothetical protein
MVNANGRATKMNFTTEELSLLIEALIGRANRRASMARFYPRNAKQHASIAVKMRKLAERLLKLQEETAQ